MATQEIELNEALAEAGHRGLGDRPRRADRAARRRPAQPHPGARDPPQPRRDPRDLPARDGRRRPARARRPHRRAGRAGRRGPPAPAREVPARQGRHLRGQLRRRRDRDPGGRGVRGQRPDVPDPARGADQRGRHREGGPDLRRPRLDAAAAAALLDRRADEPLHLDVDRRHPRRRPAGGARRAARQRPHPRAGRRGRAPGAALHPLLGLPQRLPGLRAHRRPRLRLGLPRPDRRDPQPAAQGHGRPADRLAALRLLAVRGLLRGLPGAHRHPRGAGPPAREGRRRPPRRHGAQGRGARDARPRPGPSPTPAGSGWPSGPPAWPGGCSAGSAARRCPAAAAPRAGCPAPAPRLDRRPRPARPAAGVVPRLVAAHRRRAGASGERARGDPGPRPRGPGRRHRGRRRPADAADHATGRPGRALRRAGRRLPGRRSRSSPAPTSRPASPPRCPRARASSSPPAWRGRSRAPSRTTA